MIRRTRLSAAFAFGAGLTLAGAVLAQTQGGSAAPAAASADPAQSVPLPTQSWDSNANQPVYSVRPPPDSSPDVDLPTAVGGYAKSVAGCVLIGCDDGPQPGGAPLSSSPDDPLPQPPVNLRTSDPR
jgi:hypothetical protein